MMLDQACVDLIYAAPDGQAVVDRIELMQGLVTLGRTAELGVGSREYELKEI